YPILPDPTPVRQADLLLLESTYGNRLHESPEETRRNLADVINRSVERGGVLLVPAFAVGRTQTLLYLLRELEDAREIPQLPIIVDSPMAVSVCRFYQSHTEDHDEEAQQMTRRSKRALYPARMQYSSTVEESKALNEISSAAIIISASGMMTGGRVLHHARRRLPDRRNTILLVGYQAEGTRGRDLEQGRPELKIFGEQVAVKAEVARVDGLSAHADAQEIMRWLGCFEQPPGSICLVHGEPQASGDLAERIRQAGWPVRVPRLLEHAVI
ncbi:MAG: MBL fold metallo-hydrolase, partial [Deltaproteobacteria bacterium]|nr:MBL fold metallo-hydrolase [Deltaproteobacteria bacterium]